VGGGGGGVFIRRSSAAHPPGKNIRPPGPRDNRWTNLPNVVKFDQWSNLTSGVETLVARVF
jgi:hypothetical protein